MKKASQVMSALMFIVDFLSSLFSELRKRNIPEEMIFNALKSKRNLIPQMAEKIADLVAGTKTLALQFLAIAKENISISISAFSKSLFTSSRSLEYYIWDNFQNWILNKASLIIPEFKGTLKTLKLTKNMHDPEILKEIGESNIFSIDEVCAIFKALTERQPNGESGELLNNGYSNIIYVRLSDSTVVPADVHWDSDDRRCDLDAYSFDNGDAWSTANVVVVRG